jgi:hypothetical protein
MAISAPRSPEQPIPNSPFYYPPSYYLGGGSGPLIVGAGLYVDPSTGTISVAGAPGVVNSVNAGTGISITGPASDPIVNNLGILSLNSGVGISITGSSGVYTISNTVTPNPGTVTSVIAGTGLSGGTITSSGTISLTPTGVAPATYTNATVGVDAFGRVTSITNGMAAGPYTGTLPIVVTGTIISVNSASISAEGIVQLDNSLASSSQTTAATSLAAKNVYDVAIGAVQKTVWGSLGDLAVAVGPSTPTALPVGSEGQLLKVCSACVTTGGLTWGEPNGVTGNYTFGTCNVRILNGIIVSVS